MIWFASITINLGPTFLSGALAANTESGHNAPSCPLVHGPFRHYILNVLWIVINIICVALTLFHLRKLHRDLTKANVEAVSETTESIFRSFPSFPLPSRLFVSAIELPTFPGLESDHFENKRPYVQLSIGYRV